MSQKLVSVLTPCYNADKYIHKLLDSILSQTHANIEMIVVDDGSLDNSMEIIKSYVSKFKKKGYKLEYIHQENQGQSVAINNGLKLVKGDYLVWPDADDYYTDSSAISEMANVLKTSNDEVSMVRVQYNVLDENGKITNKLGVTEDSRYKTDLFEDAVLGIGGFWYPPGGYMTKVSKFDELILDREIYTEKNAGQNFQLYLPLLHKHACLTIEKQLFNIVARDDSHSRDMTTNSDRQLVYYRTIKSTLSRISLDKEYRKYLLKKVYDNTIASTPINQNKRPYRTYIKRIVKGITPYGLIALYRRRYN